MKKIILKIGKSLAIGLAAVILVTIGIDASDNYDNFSESIIGRIVSGESEGPCPKEMIFISNENGGFCIDKYEASAGDDCPFVEVTNQSHTRSNIDITDCKPVSEPGVLPWRFISQTQAITACAKAGKRLPTDEEWYQASLGTPDKEKEWIASDCQVGSNWDLQPGLTGSGEDCVSSFGVYDMIGNVWEWVKGEINNGVFKEREMPLSGFIKAVDANGLPIETGTDEADPNYNEDYFWIKSKGFRGMARGGYWDNKADAGIYAMYLVPPTSFAGTGVGFRCVK